MSNDDYMDKVNRIIADNSELFQRAIADGHKAAASKRRSPQPVDTSEDLMSTSIRISDDGRSVTVLELVDGGYRIEWMRLDGDVEVITRVAVSPEALVATVAAARAMLEKRGITVT